jgi:Protein of unknown function (DUF3443)
VKRAIILAVAAIFSTGLSFASVNNVQSVIVDYGPQVAGQYVGSNDVLYTTVTVCVPGTSNCQSIDHILVDTGSTGLRIVSSVLTIALPRSADSSNNQIGNCIQYADSSYQWGPVAKADVRMAGEVASSVPIQVVGPTNFPAVPRVCSAGGTPAQTVSDVGANGILGVGLYREDCGPACTSASSAPAIYFSCSSTRCSTAAVSLSAQLQNPVWMFPQDNNGLSIILPQIAADGALSVTGSMIFGIGTQSNNGLNGAPAQAADDFGNFTTTFKGVPYSSSFIDSGSNGIFFLDSSTTGLADCASSSLAVGFYCPNSPVSLAATIMGPNPNGSGGSVSQTIAFSVGNALSFINSPNVAFNNLGGSNPGTFDWGLPFFFGRTVFVGIEGQNSTAGAGPYWAVNSNSTPTDCTYQLNLEGQAFPAQGGTGTITITTSAGCPWTVGTLPADVALTSASSGTGSGTVTFQVFTNSGAGATSSFTIAGQTFTIEQEAATIPGLAAAGSLGQVASEGTWDFSLIGINLGASAATARFSFADNGGNPLDLPLTFPQSAAPAVPELAATLDRTLNPNAQMVMDSTGPDNAATLIGSGQLLSNGNVSGFGIFSNTKQHWNAVVPLETRNANKYILAFDNTDPLTTGVAIASLAAQATNVPVIIRDDSGAQIGNPTIQLSALGHTSFMLNDPQLGFPVTNNKRGTIEFDTPPGGQISVLGLRANGTALTTLPVLANVAASGGSITHLAYNGGWTSVFYLVNTGNASAQFTLTFFDESGIALAVPLLLPQSGTVMTTSALTKTLAAGAMLVVDTQAQDAQAVVSGSAQLTTTGNISGFEIFSWTTFGQEASVPLESRMPNSFVLVYDNTNQLVTGLALANLASSQANISVNLRDDAGTLLQTTSVTLPARGHTSFLFNDTTQNFTITNGRRGTAEFVVPTGAKISVIGLRAKADGTLTTIPILIK